MGSGRSTSSTKGDTRARRSKAPARTASARIGKDAGRATPANIAPLYKRLPHGPHRLERDEVVRNQRTRIHGALIEAVASCGYEDTSVKQVIALAGVSRRSFYEQFANKQECFLATFDLIARRELQQIRRAYLAAEGSFEERVRASLQRFTRLSDEERKAAMLVVLEAQSAGVPGQLRLRKAMSASEQMLAQGFAQTPGAIALPMPIVRCITGGLHGMASAMVHRRTNGGKIGVVGELLDWTLLFQTPETKRTAELMAAALAVRIREIASTYGRGLAGAEAASRDERTRILQSVLRLATREDYRALSAPQIADEANVPIDAFCELFEDRDECYLAALDMIGDKLLAIAADPELVSEEWPRAVRNVLAEMMRYLADHPLHARTLAQEGFLAGPDARERIEELALGIGTLLTEGAPERPRVQLVAHAIAGAIWHMLGCQVAAGRIPLLAALSDHLAYVVLMPHIGAEAAAEILCEERVPASRGACGSGVRRST